VKTCLTVVVVSFSDATQRVLAFDRPLTWAEQMACFAACLNDNPTARGRAGVIFHRISVSQFSATEILELAQLAKRNTPALVDVLTSEMCKTIRGGH
jgi:hypothetical protein